jgi:hypothetical protein
MIQACFSSACALGRDEESYKSKNYTVLNDSVEYGEAMLDLSKAKKQEVL